ncbi:MAG: glycosyltransferase [Pseudomonadales bacterium]|nr:glycosyltransferase [Pseudomonadales bacterium]
MRIALETQRLSHRIRVYTLMWQGEVPTGFEVIIVPVSALTNHSRYRYYYDWVSNHLSHWPVDHVVGFNKMPGLDIYYAADSCYEDKAQTQRSLLYRSLPRYEMFSRFEKAVFGRASETEILMISPVQVPLFEKYYETQRRRVHLLSPGIGRDRIAPLNRVQIRMDFRREMAVADDELLLLMIGSGFVTKGLDRALIAVATLSDEIRSKTRLMVIGQDSPRRFLRMAKRLDISDHLTIFKGRDDIPRFLLGADLLLHPAYVENTGTVLLEAIVAGLPVLATDICGYAHYIEEAAAGQLIPSPYQQETFSIMLQSMMLSEERKQWSENGIAFSHHADIYDMPKRAAEFISEASTS